MNNREKKLKNEKEDTAMILEQSRRAVAGLVVRTSSFGTLTETCSSG